MTTETPDHVKALWQGQQAEGRAMTLDLVRRRARLLDERGRGRRVIGYVSASIVIAGYSFALSRLPNTTSVAGGVLIILAAVNVIYQTRAAAGPPAPAEFGAQPGLDFYRQRLAEQRDHARTRWRRVMLPVLPGCVVLVTGLAIAGRGRWIWLAIVTALGAYPFIRVRILDRACAAAYERDLAALDRLEHPS
jgi:hypothetical protein